MNNNLNKAIGYCSRAEHCIEEVRKKLWDWSVPAEEHEEILKRLVDENFINEERYAHAYVNDKFRLSHWGRIRIKHMLHYKKIDAAIIDAAISSIDEEEYIELVKALVEKEKERIKVANEREKKEKLMLNLVNNRGFEANLVKEFIF